jgi:hypothetical protein
LGKDVTAGMPVSWSGGKGEKGRVGSPPGPRGTRSRHAFGLAEQLFAGGQAATVLTDILEIFKLALAIVFLVGSMLHAAIGAFHRRSFGIAQVPGFCRHGPAGFTDKRFLFHGSLLVDTSGYTKGKLGKGDVNSCNNILI